MFFKTFPKTLYTFNLKDESPKAVTNIFSRFRMKTDVINNAYAMYKYQLQDGDAPEIVAFKEYGDPTYYWIICYANDLLDPHFDFPLSRDALEKKILSDYGYTSISQAYSANHHLEMVVTSTLSQVNGPTTTNVEKFIITDDQYDNTSNTLTTFAPSSSSVTFYANNADPTSAVIATLSVTRVENGVKVYDYEDQLNESKREIKLIKSEYVPLIVDELQSVLNG